MRSCQLSAILWINTLDSAREGDGLPDMFDPTDPGDSSFHTHAKATMRNAPELAQVQVPAIVFFRQTVFVDALK